MYFNIITLKTFSPPTCDLKHVGIVVVDQKDYENDTINSSAALKLIGSTSTEKINSQTKNSIRL
ncbi:MAG TPA: hypothetical protein PLD63_10285 [Ignavibacteria bacterium]|nr:hypothetical protein [Ignavibacteria bacterium]